METGMRQTIILVVVSVVFIACADNSNDKTMDTLKQKQSYFQNLEYENNISYNTIINTRNSYTTSMCYTKTKDEKSKTVSNPCYSCHTKGKTPNYYNDTNLQLEYTFPKKAMKNPYLNLFKDRSEAVQKISDEEILTYVRQTNYFDGNGAIILADGLPQEWKGYRPDCYFNFDEDGFDRDNSGEYTRWRAFRYYPFLGTFWPTNGSMDDVLIRLDTVFTQDESGDFDKEVYALNLAIVESLVKQKDINLSVAVDESKYGIDLNQNEKVDTSKQVVLSTYNKMSYVGRAKQELRDKKIHLAPGLFPEGTEFLHSVRYIDWDDTNKHVAMSARMKELRYAKKESWKTYSEIERIASSELNEALANGTDEAVMATFRGDYEHGLSNAMGWIYQGFIEDKGGDLRPQTHEETIGCMGCHSHLGATNDSIFSFTRKFEGTNKNAHDFGWNHWGQKDLVGIQEPKVSYRNYGQQYEYSFYLQNNHSGNEFRNNTEVENKFFDSNGAIKEEMLDKLHVDISQLLLPSKKRALALNKGYKVMVEEQSYIYGRDANVKPMKNVFKIIQDKQTTGLSSVIVR